LASNGKQQAHRKQLYTPSELASMTASDLEHRAKVGEVWAVPRSRDVVARAALAWAKGVLEKGG